MRRPESFVDTDIENRLKDNIKATKSADFIYYISNEFINLFIVLL